jgi:hypothetical protein
MSIDVVSGCDTIDAGPDWLRVKIKGSPVLTIPWTAVRIAGLAGSSKGSDPHKIDVDTSAPSDPAHQSLWIIHPDGIVEVKLEESSPKRTQILETFAEKLGDRWQGTRFSAEQIMMEMFSEQRSAGARRRRPKVLIVMLVVMVLTMLAFIVAIFVARMKQ